MQTSALSSGMPLPLALEIRRTYPATPERVYRAWTSPAEIPRWWGVLAGGAPARVLEMDVRVGGRFAFELQSPKGPTVVSGIYLELAPPRRIAFSWIGGCGAGAGNTTVTIDITATPGGGCELTLRHAGFLEQPLVDQHNQGWTMLLDQLVVEIATD